MDVLGGATIFWLIALGMVAGAFTQVCIWDKGVELITNLVTGIVGSVIVGSLFIVLQFPAGLAFGFLGSLAILFITNVFHLQPEGSH